MLLRFPGYYVSIDDEFDTNMKGRKPPSRRVQNSGGRTQADSRRDAKAPPRAAPLGGSKAARSRQALASSGVPCRTAAVRKPVVAAATHLRTGMTVEGSVSPHRSGFGFLRVDAEADSVFLPPREMQGLMPGDRVRVVLQRGHDGRLAGQVQQVLARGVASFLATVEVQGRTSYVDAVDRRLGLRCHVAAADLSGARAGDWVIARITRYAKGEHAAQAAVERVLDPLRPLELATAAAIARSGLPTEFPPQVVQEAAVFGTTVDPAESARRIDLRELPLVTIDGDDARDFDDAVYAQESAQGYRLIVAIADVSYYVREGTALDTEARARGTSVYFPQRVLPMLPPALSDQLCSLAPRVDRLCFVADMQISRGGQLGAAKFYPAVMRSHARLTYTLAHAALFEGKPDARAALGVPVEHLLPLLDVYKSLHKARRRRGALEFESSEAHFDFDPSGQVRAIQRYARNEAHKLIEECMILANVAVARELGQRRVPTLYRVHAKPEEKKLDVLLSTLAALGLPGEVPENPSPKDLRAITERMGNAPERAFVESLVVRSMPQALYQPANLGHFGLALREYAHFTSPIRRYPDLVVHRSLKRLVADSDNTGVRYAEGELTVIGADLSRLEKRADEADRYVDNFLKCAWLRERIGQTFNGLITTVVEFGCFVQILDVGIDGLLHVDNLRDDDYVMTDDGHGWSGRNNKRRLRAGSQIRVVVTSVNPVEGLIDLDLAPAE